MGRQGFTRAIQTRAISSVYGKIEQLLLAYPGSMPNVSNSLMLDRYKGLFAAFGDRVTFIVIGNFGNGSDLQEKAKKDFEVAMRESHLDPSNHRIVCVHAPLAGVKPGLEQYNHSEFVQDPFLVLESEIGGTILLEPLRAFQEKNAYLAEQIAIAAGILLKPTALELEGGNILIGDDYALIGRNLLIRNLKHFGGEDDPRASGLVSTAFQKELNVKYVLWIGTEEMEDFGDFHSTGPEKHQPFFHLDYFLTLAGKASNGEEMVLLANIDQGMVKDMDDKLEPQIDRINLLLTKIGRFLKDSGRKFPGPRFTVSQLRMGGQIIKEGDRNIFRPFSYNNAHVEWYHGIRRIYLPSFESLIQFEREIESDLEFSGFEHIVFVSNAFENVYAKRDGSLHCISLVTQRSNY